jgi:hypothetical protein
VEKEYKAELSKMAASHKATLQRAHLHPYNNRVEGKAVPLPGNYIFISPDV